MSEPSWLTRTMVDKPVCLGCSLFILLIFVAVIAVIFEWMLPGTPTNRDFFVWGSEAVNDYDKTVLIASELQQEGD